MPEFFDLSYFRMAMADIDRASKRAAMWAVRESARRTGRAAKKLAPVYNGPPRNVKVNGKDQPIIKGEYKKSIKSSRRLRPSGATVGVTVGPRGAHPHLYAGKIEQRLSPMGRGYAATLPQVRDIHEAAMKRALRKYGRL